MIHRYLFLLSIALLVSANQLPAEEPINIGNRRELFVDHALTASTSGEVELRLHHPIAREIALTLTEPWEGTRVVTRPSFRMVTFTECIVAVTAFSLTRMIPLSVWNTPK
ncbi:MAG: hypothetical protein R3C11_04665 [Planctomycetaceae bacterium]